MKKLWVLSGLIIAVLVSGCTTMQQSDYNGVGQCRNGTVNCGSC